MLKTFSEHRNAKKMRETNIYLCISKMYLLNHEIKCFLSVCVVDYYAKLSLGKLSQELSSAFHVV